MLRKKKSKKAGKKAAGRKRSAKKKRIPKRKGKFTKKTSVRKVKPAKTKSRRLLKKPASKKKLSTASGSRKPIIPQRPPQTIKESNKRANPTSSLSKLVSVVKIAPKPLLVTRKSPIENILRPFNIIESYMGEYQFNDLFSVLFVCTGNMCRSPMAEGILKKKISQDVPEDLRSRMWVQSCGIFAYDGNKPSENAVRVVATNQMDIAGIRSKPMSRVLVEQSDIILALSIDHLNYIVENYPSAKNKTFLLKAYGKDRPLAVSDSIPDPMGFSMEFYVKTFAEIKNSIDDIFPRILAAAKAKLEQQPTM